MPMARSTPAQKPRGLASSTSMSFSSVFICAFYCRAASACRRRARAKAVEDEQCRADRDRTVGEVERRPVVAEGVNIEEVHHVSERNAVPEVPERPAEDERKARAKQSVA